MENSELLDYTKETIKQTQKHLEFIREVIDICEGLDSISLQINGETLLYEINNITHFNSLVTISKLDVAIILKNMIMGEFQWEKMYFIKQAHLTIHETLETYKNYAKSLRELITKYPELEANFNDLNTDLKSFRLKYAVESEIRGIRNCTAGHIDQDFKKYYDTLLAIDTSVSLKMMAEFINLMDKMFVFSLQFLEINNPANINFEEIEKKASELKSRLLEELTVRNNN